MSEVELYNDVLKDLVEALIEDIGNSYMAMGALKQLNNDAKELQTMLKPETKLEDWVKAKLNLAGEYLDDVYHHLDHFGPEGRKLDEGDDFYDPERRRTQAMGFRSTVDNPKPKDMETEDRASYWISPDGEIINANKNHKKWVLDNRLKRNIQMVDDSECMIIVRFGAVSKSITLSVHRTSCDRLRILVEKVLEHHLPAASPRLRMVVDGREVPDGIKSLIFCIVTVGFVLSNSDIEVCVFIVIEILQDV